MHLFCANLCRMVRFANLLEVKGPVLTKVSEPCLNPKPMAVLNRSIWQRFSWAGGLACYLCLCWATSATLVLAAASGFQPTATAASFQDSQPTASSSVKQNSKEVSTGIASNLSVPKATTSNNPVDGAATEKQKDAPVQNYGFLPTRGSLMLDVVFVAMFCIIPILYFSIEMAKAGRYQLHKRLQVGTGILLLVAVTLFEVDMRFFTDWRKLAEPSALSSWCPGLLIFHLIFAVPTPFVWAWVIYGAIRNFPADFKSTHYRVQHRLAGKIAALLMVATATTGILFYWVAFVI